MSGDVGRAERVRIGVVNVADVEGEPLPRQPDTPVPISLETGDVFEYVRVPRRGVPMFKLEPQKPR